MPSGNNVVNCHQVTPIRVRTCSGTTADRALVRRAELRLRSLDEDLGNGDSLTRAMAQAVKSGNAVAMRSVLRQADDQQEEIDYRAEHGPWIFDR